jgi:hypothetical protein
MKRDLGRVCKFCAYWLPDPVGTGLCRRFKSVQSLQERLNAGATYIVLTGAEIDRQPITTDRPGVTIEGRGKKEIEEQAATGPDCPCLWGDDKFLAREKEFLGGQGPSGNTWCEYPMGG